RRMKIGVVIVWSDVVWNRSAARRQIRNARVEAASQLFRRGLNDVALPEVERSVLGNAPRARAADGDVTGAGDEAVIRDVLEPENVQVTARPNRRSRNRARRNIQSLVLN